MSNLIPDLVCKRLFEINMKILLEKGIKNVLIDLDNTLTKWNDEILDDDTIEWVNEAKAIGLKLCIVSNSNGTRAETVSKQLNISFIKNAAKPFGKGIRKALIILGAEPTETAIAGDQLFTDVLGGKRMGLFTVLLDPIHKKELIYTRIVRMIEKRTLKSLGLR